MSYATQQLSIAPFSQWTLNGCIVSGAYLEIDPAFVPSSPIAQATGYRDVGGYGAGYAAYAQLSNAATLIEASADSPDIALTPVSMAAVGQIIASAGAIQWGYPLPSPIPMIPQREFVETMPLGTSMRLMCSYDSGATWHVAQNGAWWPGMIRNGAFLFTKVRLRVILTTWAQGITPAVQSLSAYITGRTLYAERFPLPASTVPCVSSTQGDFVQRLQAALPARWFGDDHPVLDGILGGSAANWLNTLEQICGLHDQTRLQTASAPFIDIAAYDFYGPDLTRNPGESDTAFSFRLRSRLFQPVVTRDAMLRAVERVTGLEAEIIEIGRPADCGGYGAGAGYAAGGHYGSLTPPEYQAFVTAYRPQVAPTGGGGGYGAGYAGYSDSGAYADVANAQAAGDAAIYAAIESVRPASTVVWTRILNAPLQYGPVVPL